MALVNAGSDTEHDEGNAAAAVDAGVGEVVEATASAASTSTVDDGVSTPTISELCVFEKDNDQFFKFFDTPRPRRTHDAASVAELQLTVGDLHGNAMRLIEFLIVEGVMQLAGDAERQHKLYQRLVTIYKMKLLDLQGEHIQDFQLILTNATFVKPAMLRLIGDEFADRGQNDYFTLLVLNQLRIAEVPFHILLSNHGARFLNYYFRKNFLGSAPWSCFEGRRFLQGQELSMDNLFSLVTYGIVTKAGIVELIDNSYIPACVAVDYSIFTDDHGQKSIRIYSHAPLGDTNAILESISSLAQACNIEFKYQTLDGLIQTIQAINVYYQRDLRIRPSIVIDAVDRFPLTKEQEDPIPFDLPWPRLALNRNYKVSSENDFEITYLIENAHGHVGPGDTLGINLESLRGKFSRKLWNKDRSSYIAEVNNGEGMPAIQALFEKAEAPIRAAREALGEEERARQEADEQELKRQQDRENLKNYVAMRVRLASEEYYQKLPSQALNIPDVPPGSINTLRQLGTTHALHGLKHIAEHHHYQYRSVPGRENVGPVGYFHQFESALVVSCHVPLAEKWRGQNLEDLNHSVALETALRSILLDLYNNGIQKSHIIFPVIYKNRVSFHNALVIYDIEKKQFTYVDHLTKSRMSKLANGILRAINVLNMPLLSNLARDDNLQIALQQKPGVRLEVSPSQVVGDTTTCGYRTLAMISNLMENVSTLSGTATITVDNLVPINALGGYIKEKLPENIRPQFLSVFKQAWNDTFGGRWRKALRASLLPELLQADDSMSRSRKIGQRLLFGLHAIIWPVYSLLPQLLYLGLKTFFEYPMNLLSNSFERLKNRLILNTQPQRRIGRFFKSLVINVASGFQYLFKASALLSQSFTETSLVWEKANTIKNPVGRFFAKTGIVFSNLAMMVGFVFAGGASAIIPKVGALVSKTVPHLSKVINPIVQGTHWLLKTATAPIRWSVASAYSLLVVTTGKVVEAIKTWSQKTFARQMQQQKEVKAAKGAKYTEDFEDLGDQLGDVDSTPDPRLAAWKRTAQFAEPGDDAIQHATGAVDGDDQLLASSSAASSVPRAADRTRSTASDLNDRQPAFAAADLDPLGDMPVTPLRGGTDVGLATPAAVASSTASSSPRRGDMGGLDALAASSTASSRDNVPAPGDMSTFYPPRKLPPPPRVAAYEDEERVPSPVPVPANPQLVAAAATELTAADASIESTQGRFKVSSYPRGILVTGASPQKSSIMARFGAAASTDATTPTWAQVAAGGLGSADAAGPDGIDEIDATPPSSPGFGSSTA